MKEAGVTYTELVLAPRGPWLRGNRGVDHHKAQAGDVRGDVPARLPCGFRDRRDRVQGTLEMPAKIDATTYICIVSCCQSSVFSQVLPYRGTFQISGITAPVPEAPVTKQNTISYPKSCGRSSRSIGKTWEDPVALCTAVLTVFTGILSNASLVQIGSLIHRRAYGRLVPPPTPSPTLLLRRTPKAKMC